MVITLTLFLAFNIFYYDYMFRYDAERDLWSWTIIDSLSEPVDVLILGDSVAHSGINPEIIKEQTGLTAYNFAISAWWVYYHDIWILERYIEKFGAPKYLIWAHVYEVGNRQFNALNELSSTSYPYGFSWSSRYVHPPITLGNRFKIIIRRLFPLYYRQQTTQQIAQQLAVGQNPLHTENDLIQGFSKRQPEDESVVLRRAVDKNNSLFGEYIVSDENKQVSNILFDIIEKYEIETYMVLTPVHRKIGTNEKYLEKIQSQLTYWDDQSQLYDDIEFNPEIMMYRTEYMKDGTHLNINGANLYTQYLIDWIWGDYMPMTLDEVIAGSD